MLKEPLPWVDMLVEILLFLLLFPLSLGIQSVCTHTCESLSARVAELTHPKLPIHNFEIYYNSKL